MSKQVSELVKKAFHQDNYYTVFFGANSINLISIFFDSIYLMPFDIDSSSIFLTS